MKRIRETKAREKRSGVPLGLAVAALGFLLAGCSVGSKIDPKYGVAASPRIIPQGQPIPKGGGTYRVGKPYQVGGRQYMPEENIDYQEEGIASWYGDAFHGRLTANGEIFDKDAISAAHPTLPMPSYVRVTNLRNQKSIIVRVNDRGPFHSDRIIDLSHKSADLLEFNGHGVARVRVEYVGRASLDGSDDRKLLATLRAGEPAPVPVQVASVKPVLPLTKSARASDALPIPNGRPYSLGQATASAPADEMTSAARVPAAAKVAGWSQASMQEPVQSSANAVPRAGISASAFNSRGLY